jgi:hypothetical protein
MLVILFTSPSFQPVKLDQTQKENLMAAKKVSKKVLPKTAKVIEPMKKKEDVFKGFEVRFVTAAGKQAPGTELSAFATDRAMRKFLRNKGYSVRMTVKGTRTNADGKAIVRYDLAVDEAGLPLVKEVVEPATKPAAKAAPAKAAKPTPKAAPVKPAPKAAPKTAKPAPAGQPAAPAEAPVTETPW